ncbi:hypothetical protein MLD38_016900 [Melastoma candidum]|uniref:Uncharacterized protein n=1 Tax=Melastoma candidum TaxID=119954 RepID=A0ACB9QS08_9MYRT|nr:hypothetical protein MLD38_016900 [Melastoma candidum]
MDNSLHSGSRRKGQKRKLDDHQQLPPHPSVPHDLDRPSDLASSADGRRALLTEVDAQVSVLEGSGSDRAAVKRATHVLAELAKNEEIVNLIVEGGAVPALVKHLVAPSVEGDRTVSTQFEHEVEKGCAFALGLLAVKPEHQQLIVDCGALPHLIALLKRQKMDGRGIPPLVELLDFADAKVQRAAAGALRTLAFKNDENKNLVCHLHTTCNALPTLILMLRSEDTAIHYEAVGVIGNLVHSSPNIKKEVCCRSFATCDWVAQTLSISNTVPFAMRASERRLCCLVNLQLQIQTARFTLSSEALFSL